MPSNCKFELSKPDETYFSGETIAGTITLTTTSDKNIRYASIIFVGEGQVSWSESDSRSNRDDENSRGLTHYTSHETYIDNRTQVHGDGVLKAGAYRFTFNITLPWQCPSSYEGPHGHIRYEISLKINRYYRFDNIFKKSVTVLKTVDLNLVPAYKIPIICEETSKRCCWPCSKGKIISSLTVPFGGYVPGQIVKYDIHIANTSLDDTQGHSLKLSQKTIFTANSPGHKKRQMEKLVLSKDFPDKCLRLSNHILHGEFLIPPVPPTSARSSIICIEYILKVAVKMACCISNQKFEIPLIIGTIPIRESVSGSDSHIWTGREKVPPSAPELPAPTNNSSPPKSDDRQPPTFDEAVCSSSTAIDFPPQYPMSKFSSSEK